MSVQNPRVREQPSRDAAETRPFQATAQAGLATLLLSAGVKMRILYSALRNRSPPGADFLAEGAQLTGQSFCRIAAWKRSDVQDVNGGTPN